MMDKPTFITDPSYKQWVNDIEQRFRSQQIKAVVQVNSCKIEFYWSIGRDICEMNVEQRYGDGVIKTLSQDLRMRIPEVKGLTPGGLYYCKRFYLLYNKVFEIFPQVEEKSVPQLGEILTPLHSVSIETKVLPLNIFAIPWGRSKNNMFAQYCLEGYSQPIAVTAYEGIEILPANFNDTLPSIEDLKNEIKEEEKSS